MDVTVTGIQAGPLPPDIQPARILKEVSFRPYRAVKSLTYAIETCRDLRPDIVHFHDPEILVAAPFMRPYCGAVVYDSHEFIAEAVYHKAYVPALLRPPIAALVRGTERLLCRYVDAVVSPTPHISEYFRSLGLEVVQVANYPVRASLPALYNMAMREPRAVYTGGLSAFRGLPQMLEAARLTGIGLDLAGPLGDEARVLVSKGLPENIRYHGYLTHAETMAIQSRGMVGMSLLMPTKQYVNAIPTKVFEFLAAGLIVICSDFPFLRTLFADFETIKFVDPANVPQITQALKEAVSGYSASEQALVRSRERVMSHFTWEVEANNLFALYDRLLQAKTKRFAG